ncbi:MAG: ABC transporter permease [Hyphomicrobium aestuarii]|mgnify:CR=1 FL=1|nr:ABC transporter permease [Hyphomicrobium aestuarii]
MTDLSTVFSTALALVISGDARLYEIIALSLMVSLTAVVIGCLVGIPLGAALAVLRFPGRNALITIVNSLMGLPPVVVGLIVYLLLSRSGPLGVLGLLYTPTAMIIAQAVIVTPLIAALAQASLTERHREYDEWFRSMRLSRTETIATLVWEDRFSLVTAALAGFGRAIAEVGAVIIVGGNIDRVTRVMTTAIALETSKGELTLALALGLVLIAIALAINAGVSVMRQHSQGAAAHG